MRSRRSWAIFARTPNGTSVSSIILTSIWAAWPAVMISHSAARRRELARKEVLGGVVQKDGAFFTSGAMSAATACPSGELSDVAIASAQGAQSRVLRDQRKVDVHVVIAESLRVIWHLRVVKTDPEAPFRYLEYPLTRTFGSPQAIYQTVSSGKFSEVRTL